VLAGLQDDRLGERVAEALRDVQSAVRPVQALAYRDEPSPPNRAIVSPSRRVARRRGAMATRTSSPAAWPSESLMILKRSRSSSSTATPLPLRLRRRSAWSMRSSASVRFGSPVNGSCSAA
jgi:hypothetical protein